MSFVNEKLLKYIDELQPRCQGELGLLQSQAYVEGLPIISNDVVKLLEFILKVKRPKRILEIGTAVGFSSMLMLSCLNEETQITTIDRYPYMIEHAKENYKKFGVEDKINFIVGQANEVLEKLVEENKKYDFVFMDAAKGQYINFLPYVLSLTEKNGIIMADDVLQNGTVANKREEIPHRQKTIYDRLNEFLYSITHDNRLSTTILTVGDGVALMQKVVD